ncbi:serine protease inhibitor 3-like [Nasonia vitripennis]|uniref:Pacifastin domain-containing protein n=1 Tax=Nasonia vitripennis TaxID=7425 RepID=A0A7M7G9I1_NASVI|nr:serine protease inhibitor 3-like [Nasonia vitripennis]
MASKTTCLLLLGLLIIATLYVSVAEAKKQCVPGKSYFDGCNTCFCSEAHSVQCTRRLCPDPWKRLSPPADFYQ